MVEKSYPIAFDGAESVDVPVSMIRCGFEFKFNPVTLVYCVVSTAVGIPSPRSITETSSSVLLTLENVASSVQYRVAGIVTDGIKEVELKTVIGVPEGPIDSVICLLAGDEAVVILPR